MVEFRGVSKNYPNGVAAVAAIDATIAEGSWRAVVGPSGAGKSTLLRLVAGLETPSSGSLWIGGRRADRLPPRRRDVAMVFQNPALYPYLSAYENLIFGLRAQRLSRQEMEARVAEIVPSLGLSGLLDRMPRALSGGERQRVALGRALVRRPRVLLLDEPLSSLDAPRRAALRAALMDWHRRFGATTIHVTHDQAEALAMGDRVAVMHQGRIVQDGKPIEVYERPNSRIVAGFLGSPAMNFLTCEVGPEARGLCVRPPGPDRKSAWIVPEGAAWGAPLRARGNGHVDMGLRPEHLTLVNPGAESEDPAQWEAVAEVARIEPLGHETIAGLTLGRNALNARASADFPFRVGDRIMVRFDPARASWFDAETGTRIADAGPPG